ncbi:MAG TPA: pyridoxamine 5'-phosphate oxidase family protein [Jatrophihabitans sp.]|jgi:hypothetical protein|nr:pyridoxamine 5'-phosphate oxidase family protein [Jatrophihabitans sp.]
MATDDRLPTVAELDAPYSSDGATPTPWADVTTELEQAGVYWLSTVRPDGRPHVTPVAGVWLDGSLFFPTGTEERKAHNLAHNAETVVTTGCNDFRSGLDVVIEAPARPMRDHGTLHRLADAFAVKYDDHFGFRVGEGRFGHDPGGAADVYEVAPVKVFAYGRGAKYSATRFRF